MSNSKDPQSYLLAAGGLSIIAAGITYCAVNWDNPPEWWPNRLQPWWNKKEPEQKQTDKFVHQEDEVETTEPLVEKPSESVVPVDNKTNNNTPDKDADSSEDPEVTESLVKPTDVGIELTEK